MDSASGLIEAVKHIRPDLQLESVWVPDGLMKGEVVIRISRNPAPFPFLDLPTELRDRIYEYALVVGHPIVIFLETSWNPAERETSELRGGLPEILNTNARLLLASKRIYAETLPILYGSNVFRLGISRPSFVAHKFMADIDPGLQYIRTLHLAGPYAELIEACNATARLPKLEKVLIGGLHIWQRHKSRRSEEMGAQIAEDLKGWLLQIQASLGARECVVKAVDVVDFLPETDGSKIEYVTQCMIAFRTAAALYLGNE